MEVSERVCCYGVWMGSWTDECMCVVCEIVSPYPTNLDISYSETNTPQEDYRLTYFIHSNIQKDTLVGNWPLVIPPLLAVLDDEDVDFKIKGCELLDSFLRITPSSLLQSTGLGEVFHDALAPCLAYLPALTPEEESLRLLNAVYPALMELTRGRYPKDGQTQELKFRCLDGILRVGVLRGYSHAGEHVRVGEMLLNHLIAIVHEMGIRCVKHLKVITQMNNCRISTH